jgi:PAS domain S-box-containing protein
MGAKIRRKKMEGRMISKKIIPFLMGIFIFLGLYLTSLYSYLLFHSLTEIFSIVVACGIFMIAWNSRQFFTNNYLLFIGIAYLFVAGVDLIHTLAYKGMGVFQGYETNLATQLWIVTRYMVSLSFLIASLLFRRKLKINLIFLGYIVATSILLLSIFYRNIFPVCFIEGVGLTPFKKISEYIISLILLASIILLFKNRGEFARNVFQWIVWSIIMAIACELAFTFYIHAYGFSNMVGHFFEILSFYFIYKAIIETGLTKPYDLLFRNLKRSEVLLREEKNRIQSYLDIAGVILVVIDDNQKVSLINKKGCEILGYEENEIIGKNWFDTLIPERIREESKAGFRKLMDGEIDPVEYFEDPVLTKTGEERMIAWHNAVLRDKKGNIVNSLSSGEDITERKKMGEEIAHLASFPWLNPSPVVEIDLSGCIHYINPAAELLFPDLRSAGIKHPWFGDFDSMTVMFQTGHETFYSREIKINNNYYHQTITSIPKLDRIRTYGFDITERKKMEEEIRISRDELEMRVQERTAELAKTYKELADQSRILESFFTFTITPLVFLDKNFNFIRVNEAYAKACQRDISEFPGHNHFEFYPSDAKAIFEKVAQTKEPYQGIARPFSFPDHPEWGVTYWNWTLTPILDEEGEVEFLVFSLEDVTERRQAREALKAERQRFNDLLEMLPAYLVLLTPDHHVPFVNRFFRERFGESHGRRCFEYLFGRSEPCEICETYTALKTMAPHEWEWTGPDGRNYDVFDFPFTDTDGSTLILEMGIDITERKEIENRTNATNALLNLFAKKTSRKEYLDAVVELIRDWSKCRCVGIRVLDERGYIPYESYVGFNQEFWESENWLSIQNDQCICIRVVTGKSDPQDISVITPGGSFCCGNTVKFLNHLSEQEKSRYRGACIQNGFLSVALVPIRYLDKMVGALHLADEKEAFVPSSFVEFLESITPLIGEAVNKFRLEEEVRESEQRLRSLSSQLLTAQENERKQIARDLHDGIGQMLSAIKFKIEDTLQKKGKGRAKLMAEDIHTLIPMIRGSIEEVRKIQMDLRPSTLDDLGIVATIGWFCREFQKIYSTIHIEKQLDVQENEIAARLKTVAYRILQEAMNNIAKHSKANLIRLALRKNGREVELAIEDNGIGFNLENYQKGFGLESMKERADLSGGTLTIESTIGKGTIIIASWPI